MDPTVSLGSNRATLIRDVLHPIVEGGHMLAVKVFVFR